MDALAEPPVYWDPYDPALTADPYPAFRQLRERSPLYYNEQYDFFAVSRFAEVERGMADRDTFISGKGGILEFIKSNAPVPSGVFIFEDPPLHTVHRSLLTRVFTPKKMTALEPLIREYCANALDPLVGGEHFDFVRDLGAKMPMRVIGMLLGIPEEDQQALRQQSDAAMRTEAGKPQDYSDHSFVNEGFEGYIDWRATHPSDDLMTELMRSEFTDETGVVRTLTREELLIFINVLATAGNETTNRLIGWTGKILSEHPDQRRQIHENRALIPQAIEEILRFESPAPHIGRYVNKDVEIEGQTVPAGSAMLFLGASANRDDRRFVDGDSFDINRERLAHMSFGHGFHVCLGNALARVEGRVALDEVLNRFPEWNVDYENASLANTSTVRGWDTMPTFVGPPGTRAKTPRNTVATPVAAEPEPPAAQGERWAIVLKTPMGPQEMTASFERDGAVLSGRIDSAMGGEAITDGKIAGDRLSWVMNVTKPAKVKLSFDVTVEGDRMSGKAKLGVFGSSTLTGERL